MGAMCNDKVRETPDAEDKCKPDRTFHIWNGVLPGDAERYPEQLSYITDNTDLECGCAETGACVGKKVREHDAETDGPETN